MITSEKTEITLFKENHPEVDVEVWLRTKREISENEAGALNDMVHGMALAICQFILDRDEKGV